MRLCVNCCKSKSQPYFEHVGAATPKSPMYSNGRLTAAHRDRLQRLLNKQEMSASTIMQSYGIPQLKVDYSPPVSLVA